MIPNSPVRTLVAALSAAVLLQVLPSSGASAEDDTVAGETVVGELVQAWAEPEGMAHAGEELHAAPLSWVETSAGEAVRVPTDQVAELPVGATVEVALGSEVRDDASTEAELEPAREVLDAEVLAAPSPVAEIEAPAAEAAPALTNEVTVVMVAPNGGVQDAATLAQVVDAVNGPVAQFWAAESQGAIRLGVTASHDWMTTEASCSSPTALWNEVAAEVGFTAGPGKHLLLYVTSSPSTLSGCSYGLAQVRSAPTAGGRLYVRDTLTSLIAHEFGHNFGLGHSSGHQCNGTVEGGTCRTEAYRDFYDVMGGSWEEVGSLNAPQAELLRVLPSAQQQTVTVTHAGGAFTLAPYSGRSGIRALRLVDTDGRPYWLEFRIPAGQDGWLGPGPANAFGLQSGVLLRRGLSSDDTSHLLDGSPSASGGWNADLQVALPLNRAVPVSGGDFTVTVQSESASGATVLVEPSQAARLEANRRPVGGLDPVTATGANLDISGWAVDPDDPAAPLAVHVYIDGRGVSLPASRPRSESLAVPGAGDAHGFSWSTQVLPGPHRVCVYAMDPLAGGGSTTLGCREVSTSTRQPTGVLDEVRAAGRTLTVSGWAFDPDHPAVDLQVHAYVDGRGVPLLASGSTAPSPSPDIVAEHGFSWSTDLSVGRHMVCVYAIDATPGDPNTVLGCESVVVSGSPPVGALERVGVSGTEVTVSGWALDPDALPGPIQVHIYVDGSGLPTHTSATGPVGYPAALAPHGFAGAISTSRGPHRVCAYAIDVGGGGSTTLGCRSVVV